jgi:hypothetical protein
MVWDAPSCDGIAIDAIDHIANVVSDLSMHAMRVRREAKW